MTSCMFSCHIILLSDRFFHSVQNSHRNQDLSNKMDQDFVFFRANGIDSILEGLLCTGKQTESHKILSSL